MSCRSATAQYKNLEISFKRWKFSIFKLNLQWKCMAINRGIAIDGTGGTMCCDIFTAADDKCPVFVQYEPFRTFSNGFQLKGWFMNIFIWSFACEIFSHAQCVWWMILFAFYSFNNNMNSNLLHAKAFQPRRMRAIIIWNKLRRARAKITTQCMWKWVKHHTQNYSRAEIRWLHLDRAPSVLHLLHFKIAGATKSVITMESIHTRRT